MKTIPLGRGKVTLVNNADYLWLSHYHWHYKPNKGDPRYGCAVRQVTNLAALLPRQKTMFMHRVIMGEPEGITVDHRNHDSLDNRRRNLRLATKAQQMMNSLKMQGTTSRYKGVSRDGNKWRALIYVSGQRISLGRFTSERKAATAYRRAAKRYFGEFAYA